MNQKWKIIYFETANGDSPATEFINGLTPEAKEKIIDTIDLLEEFGVQLGLPHVKKVVGTELWELRVLGKDNIRIFYVAIQRKTFLLLHGFKKKKQKTDRKEVKIAQERLAEYRFRKSN